jgi:hypothetical protein
MCDSANMHVNALITAQNHGTILVMVAWNLACLLVSRLNGVRTDQYLRSRSGTMHSSATYKSISITTTSPSPTIWRCCCCCCFAMWVGCNYCYHYSSRLGSWEESVSHEFHRYRSDSNQDLHLNDTLRVGSEYLEKFDTPLHSPSRGRYPAAGGSHDHWCRGSDVDTCCYDWNYLRVRDA